MTLGFKKYFPWGEPTNFREKIWASQGYMDLGATDKANNPIPYLFVPGVNQEQNFKNYLPKIHTIREDAHNRWKPSMSIQMVYRGPKYSIEHHFNKGIEGLQKCVSVQKIEIKWLTTEQKEKMKGLTYYNPEIRIDGKFLNIAQQDRLTINDGFNSLKDFYAWFNKDFTGKLIHWTDFKY